MAPLPALLRPQPLSTPREKVKAVAKFPGDFKYYLSDHFGLRNLLIRLHATVMVKGLGVSSSEAVTMGKDGWLYLANDGAIEDWRNTEPFTPAQIEGWRKMLEERQQFCAARGIPYLFVFTPSKHDIYPEYMPDRIPRFSTDSRVDQLIRYLKEEKSPVEILDLRGPLLKARKKGIRLFCKTDTHWNDRGAWVGYLAIMDAIHRRVPQIEPLPESDFEPFTVMKPAGDLSRLLGLQDALQEESLDLVPRIRLRLPPESIEGDMTDPVTVNADPNAPKLPRIVVFRDSFMTMLLPWVAQRFGRGVYLWEDGFDRSVIEAERPDIVVQEFTSRKLYRVLSTLENRDELQLVNGRWQLRTPRS